jgi:nucleoid-associated protein YgaU
VDICQRNGIEKLNYTGDKSGNLTMHKWFAATGCPGPYLESKFPYIAEEVNKRLGNVEPTKPSEPVETVPEKSIDELAMEVIAGKHGNGEERKKSLGKLYDAVQKRVNEILSPKIVHTVVKGDSLWGIATKYLGNGGRYPEIVKLNGLQSTVIRVGQRLTIPKK